MKFSRKDYIEFLKRDLGTMLDLNQAFDFLDDLVIKMKSLEKPFNDKSIKVFDYKEDTFFYVDGEEAAKIFRQCHENYLWHYFINKYSWCENLSKKLKLFYNNEEEISFDVFKVIIMSLKLSIDLENNWFFLDKFKFYLKKNLFGTFHSQTEGAFSEVIDLLFNEKFILNISKNKVVISADLLKINLFGKSFLPVEIFSNEEFCIKYSCYYVLASLYFVAYKFLNTRRYDYQDILYSKYDNDMDQYLLIKDLMESYRDFDIEKYSFVKKDENDYRALSILFIDRFLLFEYCFQTIINCCFENYYSGGIFNILYERTNSLAHRLIP